MLLLPLLIECSFVEHPILHSKINRVKKHIVNKLNNFIWHYIKLNRHKAIISHVGKVI